MCPSIDFIPPFPPLKRRISGRPTINRRMDTSERRARNTFSKVGKRILWSVWKLVGHNNVTCPQVEKPTKLNVKKRKRTNREDGKDKEGNNGKKPTEHAIT